MSRIIGIVLSVIVMTFLFVASAPPVSLAQEYGCYMNGPSGGSGGSGGQFLCLKGQKIKEIRVRSSDSIASIELVFGTATIDSNGECPESGDRSQMGGTGGKLTSYTFACDEYIRSISGSFGRVIDSLTIETSTGMFLTWGKERGTNRYWYIAPEGFVIHTLWGRSGKYVDAIGVVYDRR